MKYFSRKVTILSYFTKSEINKYLFNILFFSRKTLVELYQRDFSVANVHNQSKISSSISSYMTK